MRLVLIWLKRNQDINGMPVMRFIRPPSTWKTKGKVAIFGALKTNPGKVYHQDNSKGYKIMLKFIQRLANVYKHMTTLYLIWDNAKAHEAKGLNSWIKSWNRKGKVRLKVLPLPTYSPWLNPIEPVGVNQRF